MPLRRRARAGFLAAGGVLAAFVSLSSGCSLTFDKPAMVENTCSSGNPCATGECVGGMCVAPAADRHMMVSFEVVPPQDTTQGSLLSATFPPEKLDASGARDLALPQAVLLKGGVFVGDGYTRVPVQLTFTPRPLFDGAPPTFVRTIAGEGDFAVTLEGGRIYDVLVEPSTAQAPSDAGIQGGDVLPPSDLFPPMYVEGIDPAQLSSAGGPGRLDIRYPDDLAEPCTLLRTGACTFEGRVLSQDSNGEAVVEGGLRVRAVAADGRVVSTSTLTDEGGAFSIRITPEAGLYSLRVTVPDQSGQLPDVTTPVDLSAATVERIVRLPRLEPVTLMGVVGYLVDEVPQPVGGAAISFESVELQRLDLGGEVTFRRSAITESAEATVGQFSVELLPGTYRVVVTPTELDAAGVLVTEVTIDVRSAGSTIMGQLYSLPRRARYTGAVVTPSLEPVPQVTLRARRLPNPAAIPEDDVRRFGRSSEATADLLGEYTLPLDVGAYDLVVRPAAETNFPWRIFHDIEVDPTVRDVSLDATLAAPAPVEGVVTSAAGDPVPSALVRAYAVLTTNGITRTIQIGEATADAYGHYRLLLPPTID